MSIPASGWVDTRVPLRRLPSVTPTWEARADVVVVGAGAAGMSAARVAAEAGRDVIVLAKGGPASSSTSAAQGGLAAVLASDDAVGLHEYDTVVAGAGLCDSAAVSTFVHGAPWEVDALEGLGARFDTTDTVSPSHGSARLALGREGGHSRRRIVHAGGDASGAEIARTLAGALGPAVRVMQPVVLLDIMLDADGTAVGVIAGRVDGHGRVEAGRVHAKAVVIATGGFGQAWTTTTNPAALTGDGLAAAVRAGALAQDLEFVQFHPTVLYSGPAARGQQPLVTEAMRGEGAVLVDAAGAPVMAGQHPLGDLAPRDVVASVMVRRMREAPGGVSTHLFLDATRLGSELLAGRFRTVVAACRAAGVDPAREPIPVAPGAHYTCGGIAADLSGRTSVDGMYAVGEVACTGVHGANRLASNSLTEALMSGRRCGSFLARHMHGGRAPQPIEAGTGVCPASRSRTGAAMSLEVGVQRTHDGLEGVLRQLGDAPINGAARDDGPQTLTIDVVEATSLHTVSTMVALAARIREESRGCHRRADFPDSSERWQRRLQLRADGDSLGLRIGPKVR